MREGAWVLCHFCNTLVVMILWVFAVTLAALEYEYEKTYHNHTSYKTIEELILALVSVVLFLTFRVAHGYTTYRSLERNLRNPLMDRSSVSQIVCALYTATSACTLYFVLLNHSDVETVGSPDVCSALQLITFAIVILNNIFVAEQFSHPYLVYCCDSAVSRERRKCDGTARPLALPTDNTNEIELIEDCAEEGGMGDEARDDAEDEERLTTKK